MKCKHERAPEHATFCPDCGARLIQVRGEVKVPVPTLRGNKWSAQMTINGERVYVDGSTEEEYYAKAKAAKADLIEIKKASPKVSLGKVIDKFIKDNDAVLSPSTVNAYLSYRNTRFKRYMDLPIETINWQRMVNDETKKVSPKTVRNAFALVTAALDHSGYEKSKVKLPKKPKSDRPWLDYEQIQIILGAAKGKPYELGILLALHGLRRSELLHLTAEDIDTYSGVIHVRGASVIGEGNKLVDKATNKNTTSTRDVHIVIPRLTELVNGKEGRLITTNPSTLYGSINGLCERVGLPQVGVHGLRHSYISLCFHLGWNIQTVMREGGYSDMQTVNEVYRHLAAQDANADIERMKNYYKITAK